MKAVVSFLVSGFLFDYLLPTPFICGMPTMFLLALFQNYVGRKVTLGFLTAVFVSISVYGFPAGFSLVNTIPLSFQAAVVSILGSELILLTYLLSKFAFFKFLVGRWKLKERIGVI